MIANFLELLNLPSHLFNAFICMCNAVITSSGFWAPGLYIIPFADVSKVFSRYMVTQADLQAHTQIPACECEMSISRVKLHPGLTLGKGAERRIKSSTVASLVAATIEIKLQFSLLVLLTLNGL